MKMPKRNTRPAHEMMGPQHFRLAEAAGLLSLPTDNVYEFNGGVGDMGVAIINSLKEKGATTRLTSCDLDVECVEIMKRRREKEGMQKQWSIRCCDSFKELEVARGSGVVFDCNTFTLHQVLNVQEFKDAYERTLKAKPRWILMNDSAKFRLHLNYKSYGCSEATVDEYLTCWNRYLAEFGYSVDAFVDLRTTLMIRVRQGLHKKFKQFRIENDTETYHKPS